MKTMIKRVAFLTVLVALFGMLTATAWATEADPFDPSLVFSSETRLDVYVDGTWNADLSGSYGFGDKATITAPATSGDKSFSHWAADGSVISYSSTLNLTMNAHTTLFAVYADAAPTAKPVAGFTSITRTNDGEKISFQAIASGETAGIVYSTTATGENLKIDGTGVTNVAAVRLADSTNKLPDSVLDNNNCWMLQIKPTNADTVYHAKAYVTSGGTTTYGDEKSVKLSSLESGVSLVANLGDNLPDLTEGMHTVTFEPNGGVGVAITQAFLSGQQMKLRANTFTREGYDFAGWSTTATGSVAYSDGQTVTLSGDTTLYAQWRQQTNTGGNPSTGGGTPAPTTEPITIPVSGEGDKAETATVTVEVKDNTATITSADVDKVLNSEKVGTVTVDVSSLAGNVDEVVLPAALVEKVAAAVADQTKDASGLEVKLPSGTVTFDAKTVAAIADQSNGKDVKLHLDKVSESSLNSDQKSTVKELNALVVLDAYMTVNGQRISEFNGGTATFSVPVTLADGQTAAGVVAYFVAENGDKTEIPCTYDGKNAVGTVSHFSNYVVAYDAQSAKTVEDTVNALDALPAAADVKLEDKEAIEKARAAYDALTDEQKAKVDPAALQKLTDAEAALKAKESGEPQPEPTPENPTYDSLTDTQKKTAEKLVKALKVNAETAAQMVLASEKLGVSADTMKLDETAILALKDDNDPKGSDFGKLQARAAKRTNNAITLQWKKQKNANGYMVFGAQCGKPYKLLKTIKKNGTTSFTNKKLKKGKNYKYLVVAYKNVNGKKMTISAAVVVHTNTKGGKVTVAKSLKVTDTKKKAVTKVTVKKGKTFQLKAAEVKEDKKLKIKSHRKVKFESSDPKIAKVNAKGKITGVKKGTCTVWVFAQNGIFKAIKVTVK